MSQNPTQTSSQTVKPILSNSCLDFRHRNIFKPPIRNRPDSGRALQKSLLAKLDKILYGLFLSGVFLTQGGPKVNDMEIFQIQERKIRFNLFIVFTASMLLLATFTKQGHSFYVCLRIATSLTALYCFWVCASWRHKLWSLPFLLIAILFNPVLPLRFPRGAWAVIDFLTAAFLIASIFGIKEPKIHEQIRIEVPMGKQPVFTLGRNPPKKTPESR